MLDIIQTPEAMYQYCSENAPIEVAKLRTRAAHLRTVIAEREEAGVTTMLPNRDLRIITATLQAIYEEYGTTYFD